jgi:hypothetical protein
MGVALNPFEVLHEVAKNVSKADVNKKTDLNNVLLIIRNNCDLAELSLPRNVWGPIETQETASEVADKVAECLKVLLEKCDEGTVSLEEEQQVKDLISCRTYYLHLVDTLPKSEQKNLLLKQTYPPSPLEDKQFDEILEIDDKITKEILMREDSQGESDNKVTLVKQICKGVMWASAGASIAIFIASIIVPPVALIFPLIAVPLGILFGSALTSGFAGIIGERVHNNNQKKIDVLTADRNRVKNIRSCLATLSDRIFLLEKIEDEALRKDVARVIGAKEFFTEKELVFPTLEKSSSQ